MTTWNLSILGNEAALGVKGVWKQEIQKTTLTEGVTWTSEAIVSFFLEDVFSGKWTVQDAYARWEILALAELMSQNEYTLTEEFRNVVSSALSLELDPETLKEWDDSEGREKILCEFADRLKIEASASGHNETGLYSKTFDSKKMLERIENWIEDDEALMRDEPEFLLLLDRIVRSGLGFEYDNRYIEGTRERLMLMGLYVGALGLTKNETRNLVRKLSKINHI